MIRRFSEQAKRFRWPAAFAIAVLASLALRLPFLPDGHMDEVHTIGRAMQIIYTGDLNPHFFYHPTGTMYLCVPWNILSLMSISREVGGRPGVEGDAPLEIFMARYPNPVQHGLFNKSEVGEHWDTFRLNVRFYNLLLIPGQILLLAYVGWRLNLLFPALAASLMLAFCPANIADSVYVSVNTTTGFFCALCLASAAFIIRRPPARALAAWLFRTAALSFIVGLAVACKYNAGTFLLIPVIIALLSMHQLETGTAYGLEKTLAALGVAWLGMSAGFTLLCPYWFEELARFIRNVLYQVWYFKVGHKDYNTFEPGLEMMWVNLQCVADQMGWTGLAVTWVCIGYLLYAGFFRRLTKKPDLWIPAAAFVSCAAFFLLMSNQAVFFARNFSIMWSSWFLCAAASWWLASRELAQRRGWKNPERVQWGFSSAMLALCVIKGTILNPWLFGPGREWWRKNEEVLLALEHWFK